MSFALLSLVEYIPEIWQWVEQLTYGGFYMYDK